MPPLPALLLIPALLLAPPTPTTAVRPPSTDSLRTNTLLVAGGTGLGLGLMMFTFMGISLRHGDAQRVAHNDVIHEATGQRRPLTAAERTQLVGIDSLGRADNHNAIGFAITGAVLTIVGAALLGRGVQLRRRANLAWRPTPRGLGLTLRF